MKTLRLETVFRSLRKYDCLCGFQRFLCLISNDNVLFLLIFTRFFIIPGVYVKTSSVL